MNRYEKTFNTSNRIFFLLVNLVMIVVISAICLLCVWPSVLSINELAGISGELRFIVIVITGGVLGSLIRISGIFMHSKFLQSSGHFVINYLWRAFSGIPVAIFAYILLRGVVLNPNTLTNYLNPSGILSVSILIGFFAYEFLKKVTLNLQKLAERESIIEGRIERISSALGVEILDNYNGYFYYEIREINYDPVFYRSYNQLKIGRNYQLIVYFHPEILFPSNLDEYRNHTKAEELTISGGNDNQIVSFLINPHISGGRFSPSEARLEFNVSGPSKEIVFEFQIIKETEFQDFWIEILQKNRLISVITPVINIEGDRL